MLNSLKIRSRLFGLVAIMVGAIITISAVTTVNSLGVEDNLRAINDAATPMLNSAHRVKSRMTEIDGLINEISQMVFFEGEIARYRDEMLQSGVEEGENLSIVEHTLDRERFREIENRISELAAENDIDFAIVDASVTSGGTRVLLDTIEENQNKTRAARREAFEQIGDPNIVPGSGQRRALMAQAIYYSQLTLEGLDEIAGGDLTVAIPTGYKAEIGEMFENFKQMLGNLNILMSEAKGTSGNVQSSFVDVNEGLVEAGNSIAELDSFLNVVATDMDNQVAGLKESAVAMDNIASGIQQIAESSTSVSELATETSTQANDGSAVIEKSVAQMETINQVVEDTSRVVDRLVKRTKTIDEALKAITAIADQTNLLALNASIEAARAGEHGRGFAVVAEEVSKLADQSKISANEINVLLQEINEDTNEAVQAMKDGRLESKQGIEVISQAGQAFSSIVEQVTIMTEQIQEVSSTVEEMSAGTEEVNSALADIVSGSESISTQTTEAAQKNKAQVEIANRMANVMNKANEEVEELEEGLNKFKTEKKEDKNEK